MTASADCPDRLPPLRQDQLTAAQRTAAEQAAAGPREGVIGPLVALLRSPELMTRVRGVGGYFVWGETMLPDDVRELTILIVARQWTQQYEWTYHRGVAERAGVPAAVCADLAEGRRPEPLADHLLAAYDFITELLRQHAVSDRSYQRALAEFGEVGVVELTTLAGYYTTLAMIMNMARTPVPDGTGERLPSIP
jgi:4-carboxymuconolactone decarboxylase